MRGPVWPSMLSSTRCDLSCEIGFGFSWSIPTRQPSDNCSRASSAKVDALGCHSLVSPIRCIHLLPEIQSEQNLREPFDGVIRSGFGPAVVRSDVARHWQKRGGGQRGTRRRWQSPNVGSPRLEAENAGRTSVPGRFRSSSARSVISAFRLMRSAPAAGITHGSANRCCRPTIDRGVREPVVGGGIGDAYRIGRDGRR